MNHGPLISVVICNHNYGRFLSQAIESALHQTYSNSEVIVIDDGSTDSSAQIIARFGDRITPVMKPNGGQASAYNAGFARSSGDIILFLDADDVLLANALERIADSWREGAAKIHFRLRVCDAALKPLHRLLPPVNVTIPQGDLAAGIIELGNYISPTASGNAYSRSVFGGLFPVPEQPWRLGADLYLLTRAPFYGPVIAIDEALGLYRMHGDNASSRPNAGLTVRTHLRLERQRQALVRQEATRRGMEMPQFGPSALWMCALQVFESRLRSDCPGNSDRYAHRTAAQAIRGVWAQSNQRMAKRLLIAAMLATIAVLPGPIVARLVPWLVWPQSRPVMLDRLL